MTNGIAAIAMLQLGLHACTPSTNVPGTDLYIEAADGKYHGPMQSLKIGSSEANIEVGQAQPLRAVGVFEDGTEVGITNQVYWRVVDEAVLGKGEAFEAGALPVTGRSVGQTQVEILLGELTASLTLEVIPSALMSIEIVAEETLLGRGASYTLKAMGTYRDDHTEDLTTQATWSTSDASILEVGEAGAVRAAAIGQASVSAMLGDIEGSLTFDVECRYPVDAPTFVENHGIMPYMYWDNARDEQGNVSRFDLEDVHCADEWKDTKTLIIQISAVWCSPCRAQMGRTNAIADQLKELDAELIYLEAQNISGGPINTPDAAHHIDEVIPGGEGIRLGDLDSKPMSNIFSNSPRFISAFPTVIVVRTRDMRIIANAADSERYSLDLRGIAERPEWDWTDPDNPIEPFTSQCEAGQDEASEPNDVTADAAEVGPTLIEGGICTDAPDYYRVKIPGRWRATLLFTHAVGDLDMYAWNEASNEPLMSGNRAIGSYGTNNNESFEYEGEQLIRVEGKTNQSAPYQLFIEEL